MVKLMVSSLAIAALGCLALDNMHRVPLGLVAGEPVHVRLFFLVLTSFLGGFFARMFLDVYQNATAERRDDWRLGSPPVEDDEFFS